MDIAKANMISCMRTFYQFIVRKFALCSTQLVSFSFSFSVAVHPKRKEMSPPSDLFAKEIMRKIFNTNTQHRNPTTKKECNMKFWTGLKTPFIPFLSFVKLRSSHASVHRNTKRRLNFIHEKKRNMYRKLSPFALQSEPFSFFLSVRSLTLWHIPYSITFLFFFSLSFSVESPLNHTISRYSFVVELFLFIQSAHLALINS